MDRAQPMRVAKMCRPNDPRTDRAGRAGRAGPERRAVCFCTRVTKNVAPHRTRSSGQLGHASRGWRKRGGGAGGQDLQGVPRAPGFSRLLQAPPLGSSGLLRAPSGSTVSSRLYGLLAPRLLWAASRAPVQALRVRAPSARIIFSSLSTVWHTDPVLLCTPAEQGCMRLCLPARRHGRWSGGQSPRCLGKGDGVRCRPESSLPGRLLIPSSVV